MYYIQDRRKHIQFGWANIILAVQVFASCSQHFMMDVTVTVRVPRKWTQLVSKDSKFFKGHLLSRNLAVLANKPGTVDKKSI